MEAITGECNNAELLRIIEEMTTSGRPTLDEVKCKRLKFLCKHSDENVSRAFHLVWSQLQKNQSQIRLSAVQIIDVLFVRSASFRDLLLPHFQGFAELAIGINKMLPLPVPLYAAKELKLQSIRFVRNWHEKFGSAYKQLQLAFDYLKNCKHISFDDVLLNVANESEVREEAKFDSAKQIRLNVALDQFAELVREAQPCLTEVDSCLGLLLPKPSEFDVFSVKWSNSELAGEENIKNTTHDTLSDSTVVDAKHENNDHNDEDGDDDDDGGVDDSYDEDGVFCRRPSSYRSHGVSNRPLSLIFDLNCDRSIPIAESEDNSVIINTMNEKTEFLARKSLPTLQKILKVFGQCGAGEESVKRAIDLKISIEEIFKKVNRIDVVKGGETTSEDVRGSDDSDCDEFVEVPSIGCFDCSNQDVLESGKCSGPGRVVSTSPLSKKNQSVAGSESAGGSNRGSSSLRDDFWEFLNASSWKCRAPMSNGKLCFRANKNKCPFHGVIIPRDKTGRPNKPGWTKALAIERENKQRNSWRDPIVQAEISAATGVNLVLPSGKRKKSKKSELVDVKALESNTARKRIEKILLKFAKSKRK